MAPAPAARLLTLASLGLVVAAGCADRAAGIGDAPIGDVEPQLTCPQVELAPVAALGSKVSGVQAGVCGHLVYELDDSQVYLYSPGQTVEEVEAIDAEQWSTVFSPTGRFAAWRHRELDGLVLRDLFSGEQIELPWAQRHGFVPAPDAEHGADLWICVDQRLELAGPVDMAVIAEDVDCDSVRGSSGSPRVAFAGTDHQVRFADLETLELWTTADVDYLDGENDPEGLRADWLWIDHDGRVLTHRRSRWESDEQSDADWQVMLGSTLLVDGEIVGDWSEGGIGDPSQARRRGAPVVLRTADSLIAVVAGERIDHAGEFGTLRLDDSGRALVVDEGAAELRRLGLDGGLTSLQAGLGAGLALEIGDQQVAGSGEWVAAELYGQQCLVDAEGVCEWTLGELALWHEGEGLVGGERVGLRMELLRVDDAGHALVLGIDVGPGATPDPLPPTSLMLLDSSLAPIASVELSSPFVREVLRVAGDRTLVEVHESGGWFSGQLFLVDPATGITAVDEAAGVDHSQIWIDARGEQLAFVRQREGEDRTLFAGALP